LAAIEPLYEPRIVVAIDLQKWSPDDDSIAQM
jgi:hypothetical protein